jgi:predicted  nucleic acid-binding Zn-ribbon protein
MTNSPRPNKLAEENQKLKKDLKYWKQKADDYDSDRIAISEREEKLKKELKNYKKKVIEIIDYFYEEHGNNEVNGTLEGIKQKLKEIKQ